MIGRSSCAAAALTLTACSSALWLPAAPAGPTATTVGRCAVIATRPGADWSRWDDQLCASGQRTDRPQPWLAPLLEHAVDDAELAACGARQCAVHDRAVRFYVVASPAYSLSSEADDDRIVLVISSSLVDHVGQDDGFYELAFAHELARLRLGETCGEGAQSDETERNKACDGEALRWIAADHAGDAEWTRRATLIAEARTR